MNQAIELKREAIKNFNTKLTKEKETNNDLERRLKKLKYDKNLFKSQIYLDTNKANNNSDQYDKIKQVQKTIEDLNVKIFADGSGKYADN